MDDFGYAPLRLRENKQGIPTRSCIPLMKISESIIIGVMLSPLVLILSLAIGVGVRSGAELGFVVGLLGFVFLGGIESTGFGLFALFKKWAEADKKKAEVLDRKHRKTNNVKRWD